MDELSGSFVGDDSRVFIKTCKCTVQSFYQIKLLWDCKVESFIRKGAKTYPSNYGSIFLLPLISKIIEKIICGQTISFF